MRRLLIVSAAFIVAAGPVVAQDSPEGTIDYAAMNDVELHEYLRANPESLYRQPCGDAKLLFAELLKRDPKNRHFMRGDLLVRARCA